MTPHMAGPAALVKVRSPYEEDASGAPLAVDAMATALQHAQQQSPETMAEFMAMLGALCLTCNLGCASRMPVWVHATTCTGQHLPVSAGGEDCSPSNSEWTKQQLLTALSGQAGWETEDLSLFQGASLVEFLRGSQNTESMHELLATVSRRMSRPAVTESGAQCSVCGVKPRVLQGTVRPAVGRD